MWIAKPLRALTSVEKSQWSRDLNDQTPLAQTLAWANAIEAAAGRSYLVFSPQERVGGVVFANNKSATKLHFECINGPLLEWDDPVAAPRQLATFALAVSKIEAGRFGSLSLKPRWQEGDSSKRLPLLPVPAFAESRAATLQLPLDEHSEDKFSARLRRTLRASAGIEAHWQDLKPNILAEFTGKMRNFGHAHGFTVPPQEWFTALTQENSANLRFGIVTATSNDAECQLLIALHGTEAHYLFGHESRKEDMRSALSPSAVAHRFAIRHARQAGMKIYDFNGYLENAADSDPYAGVCRFKAQFGADLVRYEVPEFRIE